MLKTMLTEQRPWLIASALAAASYYLLGDAAGPELHTTFWKGAGVAMLAVYALLRDARAIAAVMALSAAGDMAIEWNVGAGGFAFLLSHLTAIAFYLRHRRAVTSPSQKAAAAALVIGLPIIGFLLPQGTTQAMAAAIYGLALGGMAATAWTSTFPRYRVGIGAVLFAASDILIFARMGPLAASSLPGALIWPLYYVGQSLICVGVVGTLKRRMSAPLQAHV